MPDPAAPLRIVRHQDLLVVDIEPVNLSVSDDGTRLVPMDPDGPSLLVFTFPAQHVAEHAYFAFSSSMDPVDPPPVAALSAGPTRLVLALPADVPEILLTAEALLDWSRLTPVLPAGALPPGQVDGPPAAVPGPLETAIEFPYHLLLSPDAGARWAHRTGPFTADGRTELWHTRLVGDDPTVPVRAVGRRPDPSVLRSSLSDEDLDDLVTLTSNYALRPKSWTELGWPFGKWFLLVRQAGLFGYRYPPEPLAAEQMMLTPLGASVRMRGNWDYPPERLSRTAMATFGMPTPTMLQYEHTAGLGRDQLVRVIRRGYLSTGHRAAIIKTTERRFEPVQLGTTNTPHGPVGVFGTIGYLRQWFSIVVQEPTVDVASLSSGYPYRGREMPLRMLRLTTLSTPPIDLPHGKTMADLEAQGLNDYWIDNPQVDEADELEVARYVELAIEKEFQTPFWVTVDHADFDFGVVGTDWEGTSVTLTSPLVFVPAKSVENGTAVRDEFAKGPVSRRRRLLNGQSFAMADPAGSAPGSTRAPVESLTFAVLPLTPDVVMPPLFRPRWVVAVSVATAHLEAVERLTGRTDAQQVVFDPTYLQRGLAAAGNPAGAFAQLATPLDVKFGGEGGGGLARPDSTVKLLSSRQGALPQAFAKPAVSVADLAGVFGDARLFGMVKLTALIGDIGPLGPDHFEVADLSEGDLAALLDNPDEHVEVPVLRSRELLGAGGLPEAVEARFVWKPRLASTVDIFAFDRGARRSELVLDVRTVTPLGGGPARSEVRGELRTFTLTFAGVVTVDVERLAYTALPGRKPDITAEGFDLRFDGPLEFVNSLRDILPASGFSDPPAVSVTTAGINAGYTLAVPTVGVGIFSLQNLSLSALLSIPFTDKPAGLRIGISERHRPFIVTVSLFGGGGFFALGVSARGVEEIEAAIEFGGSISLNLGVASGGVSVMAGIYFGMTGKVTTLTGYLRCGGYLEVLGLISISVEFYLAFTYRSKDGGGSEVWGQASVTVCVKVAFLSKSVSLSVERRFAGASGDPSFEDCVEPEDWEQYAVAFAT